MDGLAVQNAPQFTGLRRRWRWLLNELYNVQGQIEADRSQSHGSGYTLDYKGQIEEELNELDWVFRYFDRQRNGYHLSNAQAVTLALTAAAMVIAAMLLIRIGV